MPKFRKKPVVIEASQFLFGPGHVVEVGKAMFMEFPIKYEPEVGLYLEIPTLEGVMRALEGDWIITGVNGEKYPCKPDIFEKTYEPLPETVAMATYSGSDPT